LARSIVAIIALLTLGACAAPVEELPYREYLNRNAANSSKLSLGMTKEQVLAIMGDGRTQVPQGPLENPWKAEAFLRSDDTFEVLYYLVRRHPPFAPILHSQAISVVIKNGKLVAWGHNAEAAFK
jgi:hypothetical protein